jgi:hypothetical protein
MKSKIRVQATVLVKSRCYVRAKLAMKPIKKSVSQHGREIHVARAGKKEREQ